MSRFSRNILNQVKKYLGITKQNLILLQVYKQFGIEFDNDEDAIRFIERKIHNENISNKIFIR